MITIHEIRKVYCIRTYFYTFLSNTLVMIIGQFFFISFFFSLLSVYFFPRTPPSVVHVGSRFAQVQHKSWGSKIKCAVLKRQ